MTSHRNRILNGLTTILISAILFGSITAQPLWAQNDDKELFLVAQKAFEDGFYDVAIRYIDQLLDQYPQTDKRIESNLLLGQCYFFKTQYLKAYDIFQSLEDTNEYKDVTLFWLGETYLKGQDYRKAISKYQQLRDLYPQSIYNPQAIYSIGWSHFEQGSFSKAETTLLELVQNFPEHQLTQDALFKLGEIKYNKKDYQDTVDYYKDFVSRYPKSVRMAQAYFYMGEAEYYLDDPLTASTYYAKAAEISYDNKLILLSKVSLGWSYLKLKKFKLSEDNFTSALKFSIDKNIPSDDVHLGLATLYSTMEKHEEALKAYTHLIDKFPKNSRIAEAHLGQANTFYALHKYPEAIKVYEKTIQLSKKDESLKDIHEKSSFGLAWSYLKKGDIDTSVKTFETIKENTKNKTVKISALTQIGDAYQDVEQFEKAIVIYDGILEEFPDSAFTDYVQYRQGIALLKLDKIDAATLSFQSLQTNFPDSPYVNDIRYYLALAYFKTNDWREAKNQIEYFIDNQDGKSEYLAEANYILGLSHFNLKNYDAATRIFKSIVRNFPHESELIQTARINIARSLYEKGNLVEAIKEFKSLIYKHPKSQAAQDAIYELGNHYLEASEFATALTYHEDFIKKFSGSSKIPYVYYAMGQAHEGLEHYDAAIKALKNITDPSDRTLYANAKLAIAQIFSKNLNPEQAIQTYQNVIKDSPEFKRDAYIKIAEVFKNRNDFKAALDAYQNAIASNMKMSAYSNAEIQFQIGDMYELLNQPKDAIDQYLKIPYVYAKNKIWGIKAYLRVARIFEDSEQWEDAKNIYTKIIQYETEESKFAQERLDWIATHGVP